MQASSRPKELPAGRVPLDARPGARIERGPRTVTAITGDHATASGSGGASKSDGGLETRRGSCPKAATSEHAFCK